MLQRRHYTTTFLLALLGCGDDLPDGVLETTAHGSSSSGSDEGEDIDGTADETGDSGNPVADGAPCDFDEEIDFYAFDEEELPSEPEETLNGELDCNFEGIFDEEGVEGLGPGDDFEIWIYHPQDESGDWPEGHPPFPAVFMAPGRGLQVQAPPMPGVAEHRYLPLAAALARSGFVVIAVEPVISALTSGKRRAALACAMIWAREDEDLSSHLADVMAVMGHSQGGSGAYLFTRDKLAGTNLPSGTPLDDWTQCATVAIAQRFSLPDDNDSTTTNLPIEDLTAPPLLALMGRSTNRPPLNRSRPLTTTTRKRSLTRKPRCRSSTMN